MLAGAGVSVEAMWDVRGGRGHWQGAAEVRQWLTQLAKVRPVSEGLEGGFWADMEEMGSK